MNAGISPPSNSQVEKADRQLRKIFRGEKPTEALEHCREVVERHRQTYARLMLNANIGVRRYAQELGIEAQATQRLKRMQTIIEKLTERESRMNLARMHDIGGVRVVVDDLDALRRLQGEGGGEATQERGRDNRLRGQTPAEWLSGCPPHLHVLR